MENNKRILITGGAGFIGANLARRLVSISNFKVSVIEKRNADLWRIKDLKNKLCIVYADLEDFNALSKTIRGIRPQIVFHLASYGVYPSFENDFKKMAEVNLLGTINLLESLKNLPLFSFINASTCFVYKEKNSKIGENDLTVPWNFYAATKLAGEILIEKFAAENDMPAVNLRLFTPYGFYENSRRLIPYIILNALRNKRIELASPKNPRDFIFIEDLLDLFLKIIKSSHNYRGEIFNAGSGKQYRTKDIVDIVEKLLGRELKAKYLSRDSYYSEPGCFFSDNAKAKKTFSWKINYDMESGLKQTINWFKFHYGETN